MDNSAMISTDTLIAQTLGVRTMTAALLEGIPAEKAEVVPSGWKNNARWHAGHLVVTPRLLTFGLLGEPLGVPDEYRKWFAKGSAPEAWGGEKLPDYAQLVHEVEECSEQLFDAMKGRWNEPYRQPYVTSVGVKLCTPAEGLNFSLCHDGIHLGLLLALKRALG
jgi:hypothetical protein